MTDEEKMAKEVDRMVERMNPDHLRKVDKEFDEFISTMGSALSDYAEVHKTEMVLLGKTLIIAATDDIIKEKEAEPIGALSVIGSTDDLAALYRALGEKLREQGVLEDDED